MGNPNSKPEDRLRHISKEVSSLRSSLLHSQQNLTKERKEAIVGSLAFQSGEVSSLHGKVKQKKLDQTLKDISEAMEAVISIEPTELDSAAVESDSFVRVPVNRRATNSHGSVSSRKSGRSRRPLSGYTSGVPTLRDIEAKAADLKQQIATAVQNQDAAQLRLYEKTLKLLAGDLEMIHVESDTPLEKRKETLMKKITVMYQRVTKSLKEMKRDNNLLYLTQQSRKDKALQQLQDVELHLAQNESLLDRLVQDKSATNFGTIRDNVVQISKSLTEVDVVDNQIKDRKVVLSQKLADTVKSLDNTMAKREFDSKLGKAQETYERTLRNVNGASHDDSTRRSLENLRDTVDNLEDINDSAKGRKKELVAKINEQLGRIATKEDDSKIIQQLVEDNVQLRKKVTSTDKEYTVIDQFSNYWNNVKTNFNVNSYSNISLLRIDHVLEEMQKSIHDIRLGIANKCDLNPAYSLANRHLSQSVPKLNSRSSRYGSHRSLDQLDTSSQIIKTKAKLYNVSTPELVHLEGSPNKRFSKIEEIKLQVHYIKEKQVDESHNKNLLRNKLDSHLKSVSELLKDSNKTVANNAQIVYADIIELMHKLVVAEWKERVDVLTRRVQHFNGTRYDKGYDEIKEDLLQTQVSLETFSVPLQYPQLNEEKNQLLADVSYCQETLEEKSSNYRKFEDDKVRNLKAKLQAVGVKVRRFSGTYKGVFYNQIERELNKLLLDVGEQVEDKMANSELTKDVERLLQILEQRSSLAQSFRTFKPEPEAAPSGMTQIKNCLFNIKKEIDKTPDDNVEAFVAFKSRLDLVILELSQISTKANENLEKEKEILSNEAQTLINVVDAKITLGQQPLVQWPDKELQVDGPKSDVNKEMEKLEKKFEAIKEELRAPSSEEDTHKYYKLSQDIKKLIERLQRYNFKPGTALYHEKEALLSDTQNYVHALEREAKDADYVISIERKLDKLENLLHNNRKNDLTTMAQELQAIQSKLQRHKLSTTNETWRERKTSVQQKTDDLAQKLRQIEDHAEGTRQLEELEEQVRALRPEVVHYVGLQSDCKFLELDETTMRLIVALDKFKSNIPELQQRKLQLQNELHQFGQTLDERAQQTQELVVIEQHLEDIGGKIHWFGGTEQELQEIKAKMDVTRKEIEAARVHNDLVFRKDACVEKYSALFNKVMTLSASVVVKRTNGDVGSKKVGEDELDAIARDIEQLKADVESSDDDVRLDEIDETISRYTKHLNALSFPSTSENYRKKYELYAAMENISSAIEAKLQAGDDLAKMERQLGEIGQRMNEALTEGQIDELDERLIHLQIALKKLDYESMKTRIDACMLSISLYLKKISEYKRISGK